LNRLIAKYNELKNVSFQEYQHFQEELEKHKEYRDLAEYEINRLKQKNRELENKNEQLEQKLNFENKQEQQIEIRIQN
jgi:hypothetical protein